MRGREDWIKPRGPRDRFTTEERAFIKKSFEAGTGHTEVARTLKAARRTITHYYSQLRAEQSVETPVKVNNYASRLYKPNFDL